MVDQDLLGNLFSDPDRYWEQFCTMYAPRIEGWIRAWGTSNASVEDLLHDVYYELIRNDFGRIRQWDPDRASFPTFLKVVVSRILVDIYRSRRYHRFPEGFSPSQDRRTTDPILRLPANQDRADRSIAEEESLELVFQAVETLCREGKAQPVDAMLLRYRLLDMEMKKIAELLNMTENALNVRFHRLKKHLRDRLDFEVLLP